MNNPHKHREIIIAWADGAAVEFHNKNDLHWLPVLPSHCWSNETNYRIKPPAPKWPETTMDRNKLYEIWAYAECSDTEACVKVANAALAYALETGQVVLP